MCHILNRFVFGFHPASRWKLPNCVPEKGPVFFLRHRVWGTPAELLLIVRAILNLLDLSRRFKVAVRPSSLSLIQDKCPVPETKCFTKSQQWISPTSHQSNFTSVQLHITPRDVLLSLQGHQYLLTDTISVFFNFCPSYKLKNTRRFARRLCFLLQAKKRLTWWDP